MLEKGKKKHILRERERRERRNEGSNRCGRPLHTDLCQNKVQTYQFNENNSN